MSSAGVDLPRVSFIVPARNAEATLPEALDSLRGQSYTDHEVLVHDDGSTDRTAAIVGRAARADARIRLVGSERVGLVGALEKAVAESSAEIIARMDADDLSHPERLEAQVALLDARPELALSSCLVRCFPREAVRSGMRRYEQWLNSLVEPREIAREIFVESPLCHPSVVMRREAYEVSGGYRDDGCPEDYGLWLELYRRGLGMAKVPRTLFYWRESDARLTRTDRRYMKGRFLDLKIKHLARGPLEGLREICLWGAGRTGRMWSRALADSGYEVVAFIDVDPKKIGSTIRGAPVISPPETKAALPAGFLIAAVGADGARELIRSHLYRLGLEDPRDFVCVA